MGIKLENLRWQPKQTEMAKHVHHKQTLRETANRGLGQHRVRIDPSRSWRKLYYPDEESEKQHSDVEPHHDEEVQNAVLNDRPHQSRHTRPAIVHSELQDEGSDANEGNQVCKDVRLPNTYKITNNYQRT